MQTQYIITLGAHSKDPTAKDMWKAGKFDETDYGNIKKILRLRGFPGSTILKGTGFWHGKEEDSVQIIILADDYSKVRACANQLRGSFKQQEIMLTIAGVGELL